MDSLQHIVVPRMSDTTQPVVLLKALPHRTACGHENPSDAVFCGECGASLQAEPPCPTCGRTNPAGLKFCRGCGARLLASLPAPMLPLSPPATRTTLANGRYQIQRFLGEGAKKRVYLAWDTQVGREVALALFKVEHLDEAGRARIRREAQALSRLGDHPHIVTLYDVHEEDGQPYFISHYLPGGSLHELLQHAEHHRLPLARAFTLADEICQALQHAHAHGIIHRDLKPSNVWLTQGGTAKLGDFGLATSLDHSRFTLEGVFIGTAAYLPPEHLQGKKLDARSDLYSLGAMSYEMVAGRPPFVGDSLVSLIAQHLNTVPVAPSHYNPEIPPALDALLLQLLAKTPDDRPHSATAVRTTLQVLAAATATGNVQAAMPSLNALDRLANDVFVGRERESDTLRDDLEEALAGRGRVVVLIGEPGIGKTRLATELTVYARLRGARLLMGRCHEDEGAPPYWPWVQMFRAYAAECSAAQLRSEMGAGAADIAQLIPDLQQHLPMLPTPSRLDPEQARFRLFDSCTTFFKNAAKRHPLVVFLDDLHWADPSSLLLLQFLAREISEARVLILLTCREGDAARHSLLAQTLTAVARTVGSKTLPLRSLSVTDVARFMELTTGQPPPSELVTLVHRETEGHPFFMTEIVRLLATEESPSALDTQHSTLPRLPQSVRAVIARRLEHVSGECHQLLTLAAGIGREFNFAVLKNVIRAAHDERPEESDSTGSPLLKSLDEALAARLLTAVPGSVGRYSFSHALIRATLYESLSIAQRLHLHRRIGEALEALAGARPEPWLPELAHHFFQAAPGGTADKAIAYARLAAERATASLAYEEAAAHYEHVLQLLDARTPDDDLRCSILLALGEAWQSAGNPTVARSTFRQAAELARRLLQQPGTSHPAALLARAALGFGGMLLMNSVGDPDVITFLEEALSALGEEDSSLRARVLARLAMEIRFSGSQERCLKLSEEAIAVARRVGDPATVAATLSTRHYVIWTPENLPERVRVADRMVQAAEEADNKETKLEGLLWQVVDHLEAGDLAAAHLAGALHAGLANNLRHGLHLWRQAVLQAARALSLGRLETGERLMQDALTLGQRTQPQPARQAFGVQLYRLRKDQGRLPELESLVKALVERNPTFPVWRCGLAAVYCAAERRAEAEREFTALATHDFADFPRDMNWLIGMALLSEVCVYIGDTRAAATLYSLLLPYAERNVLVGLAYAYFGSAAYYLGLLATRLRRWEAAEAHFTTALQCHTQTGARPFIAYTQCDHARMLLSRNQPGDQHKAQALLGEALSMAQELGMAGLVEKVKSQKSKEQAEGFRLKASGASPFSPYSLQPVACGLPQASSSQHSALGTQHLSVFRHDGDYWTIAHQGVVCRLQDLRGLHYLAHLLRHPHQEFHTADLFALISGTEASGQTTARAAQRARSGTQLDAAGGGLDPQAKAEYKQRLLDLREELQEAEAFNDEGRLERLREEFDFLTSELTSVASAGGHDRKAAAHAERARINVTRTIHAALKKITESHPILGRSLSDSIRTGIYCSYAPDPRYPLTWEF